MIGIELTDEMITLFSKLHDHYGLDHQCLVACEECGELIQAISKMRRNPDSRIAREKLLDETADVYIMLSQLMFLFKISKEELDFFIKQKLDRQAGRMEAIEEDGKTNS